MSQQRLTASIFIYCSIFIASSIYVMIPLQPQLADMYHVSLSFVSLSSTLFVLLYACGLLVFGILAEKFPLRSILLTGMAFLCLVTGILMTSNTIHTVVFLRGLQGFFAASFAPVTFAYCFKHFEGKLQAFVIAMVNTGFLFAGVFGQMVSSFFAALFSYQAVFVAFFCFYITCFIGLSTTLQASEPKQTSQIKDCFTSILSCFKQQTLQKLYVIAFFLLFTIMLFYGSFEIFIYREWSDFPFSLQLFRIISLVGIIPAFYASKLMTHFGAIYILRIQLILMVIGFIPVLISLHVVTVLFASLMMITSTSLSIPMVVLLVGKNARSHRSTAVAVYSFVLLVGASLGSTLASVFSFTMITMFIPVVFLILCLVTFRLPQNDI